ncbi:MAG TPA: hypothetical protein VF062_00765 [Candidatus Limnocylindrales bacterium]
MTLQTDHYYSLVCNGRVDNIVTPTCSAHSRGRWHDAELMEKEAEQKGWTKTGRGHLCPNCSRNDETAETEEAPKQRKPRAKAPTGDVAPSTPATEWNETAP